MLFKRKSTFLIGICLLGLLLSGCESDKKTANISGGRDVMRLPGVVTAGEVTTEQAIDGIRAVVLSLDTGKKDIIVKVIGSGKELELTYSGVTDIRDDKNNIIAATQINLGEVVEINYDTSKNVLEQLYISKEEWKETLVNPLEINAEYKTAVYGDQKYTYNDNIVVISGNKVADISSIEPMDVLTIKGNGQKLDSIIITKGHGYVQLENTAYFNGGIIELGNTVVTEITDNMKLTVPEGEYALTVTKGDTTGTKNIKVSRDDEVTVSLIEFQEEGKRYGSIGFLINPDGANVYIDNKKIDDYSDMIRLTYGKHEVVVTGEGYETYKSTLEVNSVYQSVEINLKKSEETTASESRMETLDSEKVTGGETTTQQETPTTTQASTEQKTTSSLADIVSKLLTN